MRERAILPALERAALEAHRGARPERWFHSQARGSPRGRARAMAGFDLVHADESSVLRAIPHSARSLVVHHHKLDRELARALGAAMGARYQRPGTRGPARAIMWCARGGRRAPARAIRALRHGRRERCRPRVFRAGGPAVRSPDAAARELRTAQLDALGLCVREILPRIRAERPGVRLRVVGERPGERARRTRAPGVEHIGELEDVREELARAALLVAPLRIGGGSRLKIVSALAAGCPVVASRIAVEGLALEHGMHLSLADEPRAFARAVLDSLASPIRTVELARLVVSACSSATWDVSRPLRQLERPPTICRSHSRAFASSWRGMSVECIGTTKPLTKSSSQPSRPAPGPRSPHLQKSISNAFVVLKNAPPPSGRDTRIGSTSHPRKSARREAAG
jgi:hypothetical protein